MSLDEKNLDPRHASSRGGGGMGGGGGGVGGIVRQRRQDLGLTLQRLADACGCAKSYLSAIENEVAAGGEVTIVGFGAFRGVTRAARAARNPRTGAFVEIPSRTVPTFAPGKGFKDKVVGWKRN